MKAFADMLIERLRRGGKWPLDGEAQVLKEIRRWIAFRESNRGALREVAGWSDADRHYHVDPLPEKISEAFADFLWGEDPAITPAAESDEGALEALLEENDLPPELRYGEEICSSEGEVWARIYVDRESASHPLLEFHSRLSVLPHWVGRRLVAAAVVSQLEDRRAGDSKETVYRLFEIHTVGRVENVLFRGATGQLGEVVDLGQHVETEDLQPVWEHALPGMLIARIPNKRARRRRVGVSDYQGIEDYLLDLNEATTIGAENARLTAKKRVVVPASAVQPGAPQTVDAGDGTRRPVGAAVPAGEDVLIADPLESELGRESSPFKVLEYSFDAAALIEYKRDLVETALTRIGITPQWVGIGGIGTDGALTSGTALRLRLIPTKKAGEGRGRPWDDQLPKLLTLMQLLDAAPEEQGGFGTDWAEPGSVPAVTRRPPLPEDQVEEAQRHSLLLAARAESTEQAVRELHPEWDEDQVERELEQIRSDRQASAPEPLFGGQGA